MSRHGFTRRTVVGSLVAIAAAPGSVGLAPTRASAQTGIAIMQVRCAFERHSFTVTLLDTPPARDFIALLPLDLAIEDYSTNEKIAYLPRKLTELGSGVFADEAPGDLCYFAPWGNLAFFHGGYRYSNGLIRLGRLDGSTQPLLTRGKYPLRLELLS